MKMRKIALGLLVVGVLTGCGSAQNSGNAQENRDGVVAGSGQPINVESQNKSEEGLMIEDSQVQVLGVNQIAINSIRCGYAQNPGIPSERVVMVRSEKELEDLKLNCEVFFGDKEESETANAFREMLGQYPVGEYVYFIKYTIVNRGGYDLKTDGLEIYNNTMVGFHSSADSVIPDPQDSAAAVMDGFMYMAAVPKSELAVEVFRNVALPDGTDGESIFTSGNNEEDGDMDHIE